MNWKESVFKNFSLYAVTDLKGEDESILKKIDQAYRGGVDIVQLRSKVLSDAALVRLGRKIRKIADKRRKLFFVNDRPDIALATGADGLHIGQDDLPVSFLRHLEKKSKVKWWIGKSTHSFGQARQTQNEAVDYIGVGPVFGTPTKPDYPPVGTSLIKKVKKIIRKPFVVIGGIDHSNVNQVLEAGATRIAVVRALFAANDTYKAAKQFSEEIKR